jgi:Ran GTPase-activating protein (RanGAP) involved in mRNA processing and transport
MAITRYVQLKWLNLDKNSFDGSKLKVIREMLMGNKGLKFLSMNQCHLGQDGANFIAAGLIGNKTLMTLLLSENNFGDEGAQEFADAFENDDPNFRINHL